MDDLVPTKEEHDSVNNDTMLDAMITPSRETTDLNINFKIPKTTYRFSNWRGGSNKHFGSKNNEKETVMSFSFILDCTNFTESEDEIAGVRCAVVGDISMTQDPDQDQDGHCALM